MMACVNPSSVYSEASISTRPSRARHVSEVWGPIEAIALFSSQCPAGTLEPVAACSSRWQKLRTVLELAKVMTSTERVCKASKAAGVIAAGQPDW